jgi:hypothetical protein
VGLFGKKKPTQEDANRAANVFAEREKQPTETAGGGVEDRIMGYTTHKGAEAIKAEATAHLPTDRISELRRIRDGRNEDKTEEIAAKKQASDEAKSTADVYIAARQNMMGSAGITPRVDEPTAEERAQTEQKGMEALESIVSSIKNESFATGVTEEIGETFTGTKAPDPGGTDNLAEDEVAKATARFRNVGFFTETEPVEQKVLTAEEKLEKDLDELDSAEKAIASFTNLGFQNKSTTESQTTGEEISEQPEGEGN